MCLVGSVILRECTADEHTMHLYEQNLCNTCILHFSLFITAERNISSDLLSQLKSFFISNDHGDRVVM